MRGTLKALTLGAVLLACSTAWPTPANAQAPLRPDSPWTLEIRPAIEATSATDVAPWSERYARAEPAAPVVAQKNKETGLTLMIVGGSALVAGLIIGDTGGTILAVGGVGVGAYGLYLYMD